MTTEEPPLPLPLGSPRRETSLGLSVALALTGASTIPNLITRFQIPSLILLIPLFAVLLVNALQAVVLSRTHPYRVYERDQTPTNVAALWDELSSTTRRVLAITLSGTALMIYIAFRHGLGSEPPGALTEDNAMMSTVAPPLAGLLTFSALGDAAAKWTKWRQLDQWHKTTSPLSRRRTLQTCAALIAGCALCLGQATFLNIVTGPALTYTKLATLVVLIGLVIVGVRDRYLLDAPLAPSQPEPTQPDHDAPRPTSHLLAWAGALLLVAAATRARRDR